MASRKRKRTSLSKVEDRAKQYAAPNTNNKKRPVSYVATDINAFVFQKPLWWLEVGLHSLTQESWD